MISTRACDFIFLIWKKKKKKKEKNQASGIQNVKNEC
jgi:hypothetical protein